MSRHPSPSSSLTAKPAAAVAVRAKASTNSKGTEKLPDKKPGKSKPAGEKALEASAETDSNEPLDTQLGEFAERLSSDDAPLLASMQVRSLMLTMLVLLSVCYTLYFAKPILFPIFLAFILNLLFRPPVRWLRKRGVPGALASMFVVAAAVLFAAGAIWLLVEPAATWLEQVPQNMKQISEKLEPFKAPLAELDKASQQAEQALRGDAPIAAVQPLQEPIDASDPGDEEAAPAAAAAVAPGVVVVSPATQNSPADNAAVTTAPAVVQQKPWRVRLEGPGLSRLLLSTTWEVAAAIALTMVLLYFLLASGDTYLNKLVEAVPTWRGKRNVVETALQIEQNVSRYLSTITLINIGQGVAVGIAMWLIGLPSPILWGAMAFVLTFIPFIGASIGLAIVFLVALMEFETVGQAIWAPLLYASIGTIQGQLITPNVLGRRMSLNPVMVLLSLIFWGWMWGISGAILAVPILAIVTATCCNIERLKPLGEFLGAPPRAD